MAIKSPKQKGSGGEYEVIALLTSWAYEVGVRLTLERNLEQVRKGGADVNGIQGLEVEVKRVENLVISSAWAQVCRACQITGGHPFLIHRQNRKPWRVRTIVDSALHIGGAWKLVPLVVNLDLDDAKRWFQAYITLTYGDTSPCQDHIITGTTAILSSGTASLPLPPPLP